MRKNKPPRRFGCWLVVFGALFARSALAMPPPADRTRFSAEKIVGLGPLLRTTDLAVIESNPDGTMRQITLFAWAAAPPELSHYVVGHPERYRDFARNMTVAELVHNPDGTVDQRYEFSYRITTVDGINRFKLHKPEPGQPVGAIDHYDPVPGGTRWHRWEFIPYGGGSILALSGNVDLQHSGYPMDRLIKQVPTLEYGLAMIGQMTLLLTMKQRAEQLARPVATPPITGNLESAYSFLLEKGIVVLMRRNQGKLGELSFIGETSLPKEKIYQRISQPESFSKTIASITKSKSLGLQDGVPVVEIEQSIPLISFQTRFGVRSSEQTVDMMGFSGDLRGARFRWDLRNTTPQRTQIVFRSLVAYDRSSLLIRQLYKLEPLFEYGINVGLNLVFIRGMMN